jgi:hypothetical protein
MLIIKANHRLSAMNHHNFSNKITAIHCRMLIVFIAQIALASCSEKNDANKCNSTQIIQNSFVKSNYYEQWRLKLYKNSAMDWNGQKVKIQKLELYLKDISQLSDNNGKLSLAFQEGSECDAIRSVIMIAKNSDFCKKGHCVIAKWGVRAPIVN